MAEPCHKFGSSEVGCRLAVRSAGGSTSLRCFLRISRLCHGFGHGWIWSCSTRRMARASTSPDVSQGNLTSGVKGVAHAPSFLSPWYETRASARFAGSRPLGRASRGARFDMGAAVAYTFAFIRSLGRTLLGVPLASASLGAKVGALLSLWGS